MAPIQIQAELDRESPPQGAKSGQLAAATGTAQTIADIRQGRNRRAGWWRAIAYTAAFVPFVFLLVGFWIDPDLRRREIPDWQPIVALAESALERGDPYEARFLYVRAGRIASWRKDWQGLLAAACGMKKLDGTAGSFSNTHTMLVRATITAENRTSRAGISAVAHAFRAIGEPQAAITVLARIRPGWREEVQDPADGGAGNCR